MSNSEPWGWDSEETGRKSAVSGHVVDLSFKLECRCLHVDHTIGLHEAITGALPWFNDEPLAGLHLIHVAGSQNGWMRPEEPDELIHLSHRTRLTLRIPIHRINDARTLTGHILDIAGNSMTIGDSTEKPIMRTDILLSRHVLMKNDHDENEFLHSVAEELGQLSIQFKRLLPGKQLNLRSPQGDIRIRSLMVADINASDSLTLQERGLGDGRQFGCGLFIHHKGIKSVNPDD